ncbi:MAG: hypothetical protein Q8M88_07415 [Phenylobacterium sp.]|uniref:hypothetical protein n=1 Tax=Phenylobacterium sp. TaxID=1871053 RepID=UPI0027364C8F|nr:hypothetical protein [Phenylobacterium sp.]MDP3174246.1 hypothetical protein [Phenylobacterium sp.]
MLKTVLQSLGLTAVIVENGREAVEAWDTGSFDLILNKLYAALDALERPDDAEPQALIA